MISKSSSKLFRGAFATILLFGANQLPAHEPQAVQGGPKNAAPVSVKAPEFILMDQDSRRFDSAHLRDKVVVLNFIFTTCTDVCPLFTVNLSQLQRKLNGRFANEIFFVSITTDPEIDSPQVLKAYAQRHGADLKNWAFLTGSESELKRVWKSFGVQVIRKGRGLVQHTSLTTVIDRHGLRRFNHWGEKWPPQELERDLLTLLDKKG
jgi:protein SCO1/2